MAIVAPLRKLGFWSCLVCMAASWLLEKEKEEGGHQAIIFALLCGLLLSAAWAIETLVPFEGWRQALRLTPAVVYGGLAYTFLATGYGGDDEGSMMGGWPARSMRVLVAHHECRHLDH